MRWEKAEQKLLGLIQMWSDTFMMQEDEFPGFQKLYRQLRKEAIPFPKRDPNLRAMMGNICADSPMFDYVEQIAGHQVKISVSAKQITNQDKKQKKQKRD